MKGTRTPLIIVLAVGILFAPLAGEAQEGSKVYKLGFLMGMDPQPAWQAAFKQGLQEFGWVEGRNITIEYLSAEGDFDRLPRLCTELVSHAVDLILAVSAPETAAAKQCTSTIPIVFAIHGDPVGTGDVKSLAHPGGNATGMSQTQGDLVSKLLGLLKETVPQMSRLAVLWNSAVKSKQHDWKEATAAAPKIGIALASYEVRARPILMAHSPLSVSIGRTRCWYLAIRWLSNIAHLSWSLRRRSGCRRCTRNVSSSMPAGSCPLART